MRSVLLFQHTNEASKIGDIISRIREVMINLDKSYETIVVDDGSSDGTGIRAKEAGANVITHPYNIGNGAAVKTGIRHATGEIFILLDGDGQHAPEDIPSLIDKVGVYDMVVGARTGQSKTHIHRYIANAIYNLFASYICGMRILDLTSGFRAIKAEIAREFITLLPNTFSYPTTITLSVIRSGYSLAYVPIHSAKRVGKSKIKLLIDGPRFFFIIFKITTLFSPMKIFLPLSIGTFLVGLMYGFIRIFVMDRPYGLTSALFMLVGAVIFLIGLVSEQITELRYSEKQDPFLSKGSGKQG